MKETITSPQNPRIKNIVKLEKTSERKKQNLTIIEGLREINLAVEADYEIDSVYICKELSESKRLTDDRPLAVDERKIFYIHKSLFDKIAYRENSDGFLALAVPRRLTLDHIQLNANPLIIVLESVEKPGNLGAILRTADAARVTAVVICDPRTDIYNPNVIRSSVGCVFTNQVTSGTSEDVYNWLQKNNIIPYAAALTAEKYYHETDLSKPTAIVMGTEAYGLSEFWLTNASAQIKIPMSGKIDSLNVSTSTAVIVFEACRQRGFEVEGFKSVKFKV